MDTVLIFLAVLTLLLILVFKRYKTHLNLPGPKGWPFIGNALQMDPQRPHETLTKWGKQFGNVYKISSFGEDLVVVNSEEGIYDVLVSKSEDFAGRPQKFRLKCLTSALYESIATGSLSPRWSHLKRVTMTGLRMVGEGVQKLENISSEIIEELVKDIESTKSQPFDPREMIHHSIANITASLVFGTRFSEKDLEELVVLDQDVNEFMTPTGKGSELDAFPWLRFLPNQNLQKLKEVGNRMDAWFSKHLEMKLKAHKEGDASAALDDLIRAEEKGEIPMGCINTVARDLVLGGTVTTSSALYALVALWAKYPEVQKRAQKEISNVIGDRQVRVKDRSQMPYMDSMLLELLRYISHLPLAVPHTSLRDTFIQGQPIPKGTQVLPNLWALHHDSQLWDSPWDFRPDRFLAADGKVVHTGHPLRKRLLPFGAGRRVCAGETMARNRLFLFAVTLLQRFNILPEAEGVAIPCDPREFQLGIALRPDSYKIKAVPRRN